MAAKGTIYISEFDLKRLKELIKVAEEFGDKRIVQRLEELNEELDRAEVVKPQEIPHDIITMNSTFRLRDLDRGEDAVYTLVFPAEADSAKGRISVLAPIGTAVLGYRLGDTIEWKVPAGLKKFKVEEMCISRKRPAIIIGRRRTHFPVSNACTRCGRAKKRPGAHPRAQGSSNSAGFVRPTSTSHGTSRSTCSATLPSRM
jgi:regulator of nucleoside diphosphate kinase